MTRKLPLAFATTLLMVSAACSPCRSSREGQPPAAAPKEQVAQGRPGRVPMPTKPITKVRIVRGVGKDQDGVALWVVEQPSTDYRAVFGGTQGGVNPSSTSSDLYLDEGWVHLQGTFPAQRDIFRVPIIITNVVGIGADATEFIVQQDVVGKSVSGVVICLVGQVWMSERTDYGVVKERVGAGKFAKYCVESGTVKIEKPTPIPADPADPVRKLADEAHALASKF
ncbi:MAG: hypothetical protein IT433_11235 [Phycisphaerales bacterium]|nr:hypothetical protein [Phycisphaerales bacterium]